MRVCQHIYTSVYSAVCKVYVQFMFIIISGYVRICQGTSRLCQNISGYVMVYVSVLCSMWSVCSSYVQHYQNMSVYSAVCELYVQVMFKVIPGYVRVRQRTSGYVCSTLWACSIFSIISGYVRVRQGTSVYAYSTSSECFGYVQNTDRVWLLVHGTSVRLQKLQYVKGIYRLYALIFPIRLG